MKKNPEILDEELEREAAASVPEMCEAPNFGFYVFVGVLALGLGAAVIAGFCALFAL